MNFTVLLFLHVKKYMVMHNFYFKMKQHKLMALNEKLKHFELNIIICNITLFSLNFFHFIL